MRYQGFTRGANTSGGEKERNVVERRRFVACNKIFLCATKKGIPSGVPFFVRKRKVSRKPCVIKGSREERIYYKISILLYFTK